MKQCRRCDTEGPAVFLLVNGTTTVDREFAHKEGWKWVSVSCSGCGDVHGSVDQKTKKVEKAKK